MRLFFGIMNLLYTLTLIGVGFLELTKGNCATSMICFSLAVVMDDVDRIKRQSK